MGGDGGTSWLGCKYYFSRDVLVEGGLLSLSFKTEMFQRVVCNLQDLLVCRVCINYPGTLPYKHNFTKWLILDSWVTTRCSSDGFVSEEMMMNSQACLVSSCSLGGRYLLSPLSSIRQTIVFSLVDPDEWLTPVSSPSRTPTQGS